MESFFTEVKSRLGKRFLYRAQHALAFAVATAWADAFHMLFETIVGDERSLLSAFFFAFVFTLTIVIINTIFDLDPDL